MAMNRAMLAALKALSYRDSELEKTYEKERRFDELTHPNLLKVFYKMWDRKVTKDGYAIPVRIFSPNKEVKKELLIFFHGGGFVKGSIEKYTRVCHQLAEFTGHTVLSVEYRLAPEHPFPTGLMDCYEVVKEVMKDREILGMYPEEVTLIGDSAGASLAAAISLMARDTGDFEVKQQILIYPLTYNDHSKTSPYKSVEENGYDYLLTSKRLRDYVKLYIKDKNDLENPYFAPMLTKTFQNQPRTLVITSQYDPLRDEGEAYGEKLKEAGNEVEIHRIPDTIHGFFSLPIVFEPVKKCYGLINDFLSRREANE
ncbi:MAG: alpha/beta hydrolase [Cellulosilyticaceae bacterium]